MDIHMQREERMRELDRLFAATGSRIAMGRRLIVREQNESGLRVETQDVDVWANGMHAIARFTTYRCIETGKPVIANIDMVYLEKEG